MKALLLITTLLVSFNSYAALDFNPADLSPAQESKLIDTLDSMEIEVVETLLSLEALRWYIEQSGSFQTDENPLGGSDLENSDSVIDQPDIDFGDIGDQNAPTFN